MKYSINIYSGEDKVTHEDDITAYYRLRQKVFSTKWGNEQDVYYGQYPTEHDARENTIFLIFKAIDPESGKELVFGGRRITFPKDNKLGTLPLEGKHIIVDRKGANRFTSLVDRDALDMDNVIPALRTGENIRYAELGAFAIDHDITNRLFTKKEDYVRMREDVFAKTLEAAKEAGIDIAVIGPGGSNLAHQAQWLKSANTHEFIRLGRTRDLFSNPFPKGNESEVLLINLSDRYKLTGPESILRHNQEAAQSARNSR